jgi:hypothetical protein
MRSSISRITKGSQPVPTSASSSVSVGKRSKTPL